MPQVSLKTCRVPESFAEALRFNFDRLQFACGGDERAFYGETLCGVYAALTDKGEGLKYPPPDINQDSVLVGQDCDGRTFLVSIDGMGGMGAGEIASREIALSLSQDLSYGIPLREAIALSQHVLIGANLTELLNKPGAKTCNMGATLVAAEIIGKRAEIDHIGDSRALILRGGQIIFETQDHSFIQDEVDRGNVSREAALVDPRRNVVNRALSLNRGRPARDRVDSASVELKSGDIIVLASDGLWDVLLPEKVAEILLKSGHPYAGAPKLRDKVRKEVDRRHELALSSGNMCIEGDDHINIIVYQHR